MKQIGSKEELSSYTTWYEFKKDLERRLGYMLFNARWLAVKPKCPLPWEYGRLAEAHRRVAHFRDRPVVMKRIGNVRKS